MGRSGDKRHCIVPKAYGAVANLQKQQLPLTFNLLIDGSPLVARALALEADILLLDEPFSAFDESSRNDFLR